MGKSKLIFILDSLVVLLNLAAGRGNILLYWLTGLDKGPIVQFIVILIDVIYILFRISRISNKNKIIKRIPISALLIVIIIFVNLMNIVLDGKVNPLAQSIHFILLVFFMFILIKLSNEYLKKNETESPRFLVRGYYWLSLISILGVYISFVLINTIGPDLSPVSADFMDANLDKGETYYRSYLSVNMFALIPRVPFFQEHGMLSGLFHETHLLAFNVFPCLILMFGFMQKTISRWLIIISSILIILFAGSATNILVSGVCLVVFLIVNSRKKLIGSLIGAAAIALAVVVYISIDDTLLEFLLGRLDEGNGSQQYSVSLLEWTFSPRTLMGSDFFSTDYVNDIQKTSVITKDVGYIPFFLNLTFIIIYLKDTVKLIFTRKRLGLAVGLASLYLILHSAKIGMTLFAQTLPLLMVYIQAVTLKVLWKNPSYSTKS